MEVVCSGCTNDIFNQLGHMDCPNGCLHDVNECSYCSMNTKNHTVIFKYTGKNDELETVEVDYDKVSHCKIVINTVDIFNSITYVPLNKYPYESVIKYIKFVINYSMGNYTKDDFDLGIYIGDDVYIKEVLNKLTKSDISSNLCEMMIGTNNVIKYESQILKCLTRYVRNDLNFRSFIDTTNINKNKIINTRKSNSTIFNDLINSLSGKNIMIILKNYVLWDHVIGTYIYIRLCKQGFKKCGVNMIELIQYKDKEKIFCREILELYHDENKHMNIFLSHIFRLKNNVTIEFEPDKVIKYRRNGARGAVGTDGCMGHAGTDFSKPKMCQYCYEMGLYI